MTVFIHVEIVIPVNKAVIEGRSIQQHHNQKNNHAARPGYSGGQIYPRGICLARLHGGAVMSTVTHDDVTTPEDEYFSFPMVIDIRRSMPGESSLQATPTIYHHSCRMQRIFDIID